MTRPQKMKKFKLFNIKSGEVLVLDATMEELNYIMIELLKGKYLVQEKMSDSEFLLQGNQGFPCDPFLCRETKVSPTTPSFVEGIFKKLC